MATRRYNSNQPKPPTKKQWAYIYGLAEKKGYNSVNEAMYDAVGRSAVRSGVGRKRAAQIIDHLLSEPDA